MKSLIGKVVGGCQILAEIAQGGMGVIYKAKQLSLDREVALKILADRLAGDPSFVERFLREARAIARVNHPNILAVYDAGQDPDLNLHYMIMELIDGRSLSDILAEKGVLPPRVAAEYIRQAALGLGCAQAAGIIHRDVKPDNIMVTRQDIVKVSDFGLAKEIDAAAMTATDSVMGTPAYMSPEQCDGKKLDGRTDIYSLGGTFYRLITGRLPFEAETAMSMMYRHKHEPVIPPRQVVPTIPQSISDIVVKMMAKRREDRYQTMDEVVKAIEKALAEGPGPADTHRTLPMPVLGAVQAGGAAPASAELGVMSPRRRELERLLAQGDARLKRGDLPGAVRLWREAKAVMEDPRIDERLAQHAKPEAEKNKREGQAKLAEGELSEAAKLFRSAMELDPDDQEAAASLREVEERLTKRREAINQVRQLLAANRLEEAVRAWDELPQDFRDESLEKQIRQVKDVVLPVAKLCEQADAAMQAGDLEKALMLYRRAVDVDGQNEQARSGMREAERRLGRIERMLKDGYEFNVKEDYERAIEAWSGILKVVPNHAQARKLITEARLRLGHMARQKEGGLAQAIQQWKEILKLDPQHQTAQALLEEDSKLLAELNALAAEAQDAFARRKYRRAIARWRKMQDIDPNNRKLDTMIDEARRLARRRMRLRLFVTLAVVVVGGSIGELVREFLVLSEADAFLKEGKPGKAALRLENASSSAIFLRGAMESAVRRSKYLYYEQEARRARGEGRFDEAVELYLKARSFAPEQEQEAIDNEVARTKVARIMAAGRSAEDAGDWKTASSRYGEAFSLAKSSRLDREQREAEGALEFALAVDEALRMEAEGRPEAAAGHWRRARAIRPDHEVVKAAFQRLKLGQ